MPSLHLETSPGTAGIVTGGSPSWERRTWRMTWRRTIREVSRLLALLGEKVRLRFVRGIRGADIQSLSRSRLNILREPEIRAAGESFAARFGTPYIDSFPVGLSGSLRFIEETAEILGLESAGALREERAFQEEALAGFEDLSGERIRIVPSFGDAADPFAIEAGGLPRPPLQEGRCASSPSLAPTGRDRWARAAAPPLEEGAPCLTARPRSGHAG